MMKECSLREVPCLEYLLGLKLSLDLKWNLYIESNDKDTGKIVSFLYCSSKYPTPAAILYFHKNRDVSNENSVYFIF